MICANCKTVNEEGNVFCVSCGNPVAGNPSISQQPTVAYSAQQQVHFTPPRSTETPIAFGNTREKGSRTILWIGLACVALIALIAGAAVFMSSGFGGNSETLPDHLGMFVQSDAKDRVDEIRRKDFASAVDARNELMKGDLSVVASKPNLILYADSRDVPVNDMRLVQLDTMKDDGTMKTLDFQVAPVDGKPEMKRIRMAETIASGRYAFALFDSYFNEGKHKFWAFQVRDSSRADNGDALKTASVSLKPKTPVPSAPRAPSAPAAPSVPPPAGGTAATVTTRLKLRSGPTQFSANQIGSLNAGTRVYIMHYSSNSETYNGRTANFAYVQTDSGLRGWAFAAYLR